MARGGGLIRAALARALFVPVGLLVIAVAAFIVPLPVYAERPGASLDLTECIDIDSPAAETVSGDLLLTFATFRRATAVDLLAGVVADDVVLRPVDAVVPEEVEPSDFFRGERQRFDAVAATAAAVGLERAGFPEQAQVTGRGVRVVRTLDGFPAEGTLQSGDIVIGAAGESVGTAEDLRRIILRGEPLTLRVHRGGGVGDVPIAPVRREIGGEVRPVIGATLETVDRRVELPVDVTVNAGRIGGPSAGLMIALDVYDAFAEEDLVAGRRVAGTGEIDPTGRVGRIGALPLKVIAAAQQGAGVFLVPASQVEAAREAAPAGSGLEIVGVETIDDAIAALRDLPPAAGELADVRFRSCAARVTDTGDRAAAGPVSSSATAVAGAPAPRSARGADR